MPCSQNRAKFGLGRRPEGERERVSRSSSSKRRDWTGSGSIGCWRARGSRAILSTPPRLRPRVDAVGRRPTVSTGKHWFGRCWLTSAASRVSVRWSGCQRLRRRIVVGVSRERKTLTAERVGHVNRIKGLLFAHGVEYEPLHRNRRARLEELRTRDGRPCPPIEAADQSRARSARAASRTDQGRRGGTRCLARAGG